MNDIYLEAFQDNNSLAVQMDRLHKQAIKQYEDNQRFAQMKKDIVEELKPFITQAIDIKVQNNATPALQELNKMLKNLGNF